MKASARLSAVLAFCLLCTALPAQGQIVTDQQTQEQEIPQLPPQPIDPPGRVADSAVGEVGQRQTRGQAAQGVVSTARVGNRIPNRVQSRLRNRIDRYYDPQANATSPFVVAEGQARRASNPSRR